MTVGNWTDERRCKGCGYITDTQSLSAPLVTCSDPCPRCGESPSSSFGSLGLTPDTNWEPVVVRRRKFMERWIWEVKGEPVDPVFEEVERIVKEEQKEEKKNRWGEYLVYSIVLNFLLIVILLSLLGMIFNE